jgi:hypothetical protein
MLISQHTETGSKGSFFIEKEGKKVAEMTYSKAGDKLIIIDHTSVDDSLRGQGAGNILVESAVQWARQHAIKIMPLCPFANSVFQKHEEFRDVLK